MAVAEIAPERSPPATVAGVTACERRGGVLYPPKLVPPARMPGALEFLRLILKEPLLSVPPDAYHEPVVIRRWPMRLAYACHPATVRDVLVDRRADFDEKPSIQRYVLGPLLGNGILLAEGADWRWQRQTAAPMFRHAEILNYVPIMSAAAENVVERWRASEGPVHMIDVDMTRATYDVIARTILVGGSEKITETTEEDGPGYNRGFPLAVAFGLMNAPSWLPRPGRSAMNKRDAKLRRIVAEMVDQAASEDDRADLLARLRTARNPDTDRPIEKERLIDNVLTFLLAGHHTTAMALTWALYVIACAPEWEERMLDEIESIVPEGPVAKEQVDKLVVVQQVIKEAMRLFPPVPVLSRIALRDSELAGRAIAKGTIINIPVYAIHRHRRVWEDADRFDPTRFAPENEKKLASCQFLPFGAGPRVCIGMSFAMIEATVFLATMIRAARFELVSEDYRPVPTSRVVLTPKDGLPLTVTLRQ